MTMTLWTLALDANIDHTISPTLGAFTLGARVIIITALGAITLGTLALKTDSDTTLGTITLGTVAL